MTAPGGANVIGRAVIKIIPDVKDFARQLRRQLHSVNTQLRTLQRDLRPVNNALRFLARNATGIAPGVRLATRAFTALAAEAIIGGILALGGALYELSGTLLLIPAGAVAAGAALGTLRVGLIGVEDAIKAFGKGPEEFAEALEGLAPEARKTGQALEALRPRLTAFKNAVQNALFQDGDTILTRLANKILPIVRKNFVSLARIFNTAGKELASFATQSSTLEDLRFISRGIALGFKQLLPAIKPASQAILDLVTTGSSFLPMIGARITELVKKFSQFISTARQTGQLARWIKGGLNALEQVGRIVGNLIVTMHSLLTTAKEAGLGLLDTFERASKALRNFVTSTRGKNAIRDFLENAREAGEALLPVIGALADTFFNHLVPILTSVAKTLAPSVERFIHGIGEALDVARPGIEAFARGFSTFIDALTPALPSIGALIGALGELLGVLSAGLGPAISNVIQAISSFLVPVIQILTNILSIASDDFWNLVVILGTVIATITGVIAALRGFISFATLFATSLNVAAYAAGGLAGAMRTVGISAAALRTGALASTASFLTGPWGLAIVGAIGLIVLFGDEIAAFAREASSAIDGMFQSFLGFEPIQMTADAIARLGGAGETTRKLSGGLSVSLKGLIQDFKTLGQAAIDASNAEIAYKNTVANAKQVTDQFSGGLNKNRTAMNLNTEAGRQKQRALNDLATATLKTKKGSVDAAKQFIRTAQDMGLTRNAAIRLARQYGLIPKNVRTHAQLTGWQAALNNLAAFRRAIANIPRTITVSTYVRGANISGSGGHMFLTNAEGGLVKRGDVSIVGEEGPELVAFGRAARIFSNPESRDIMVNQERLNRMTRQVSTSTYRGPTRAISATATPIQVNVAQPEVRVFIGDREIKDVVVQVVDQRDRQVRRVTRAGSGVREF